jgi:hypothetical protein
MELRPVYLLGPKPTIEPTRRLVLAAIGSAALGGALGFALGRAWRAPTPEPVDDDPRVAWARRLCCGPRAELWRNWDGLLQVVQTRAPDDAELWRGLATIARIAIDGDVDDPAVRRTLVARALAAFARRHSSAARFGVEALIPELEAVR